MCREKLREIENGWADTSSFVPIWAFRAPETRIELMV
jgi:hypothetical protein